MHQALRGVEQSPPPLIIMFAVQLGGGADKLHPGPNTLFTDHTESDEDFSGDK